MLCQLFWTKIDNFCLYFTLDPGASDESEFDAFSSVQNNQALPFTQLSNITEQREANLKILLPHELRRQRRLEKERLYLKHMTEKIRRQKVEECTIERVHQPSKETFVERYMKHGKPAILTGMMDSWESTKSWKFEEFGTKRNPPFLIGSWNSTINRTFDLLVEYSLERVVTVALKGRFSAQSFACTRR